MSRFLAEPSLVFASALFVTWPALAQPPKPIGSEFQINASTIGHQDESDIAVEPDGDFVVVWSSEPSGGSVTIFARRFNAAGAPIGSELQVNAGGVANRDLPEVDVNAAGSFVVAWRTEGQDGSSGGIFARRFNGLGAPQGGEFQVATYTSGSQQAPSVAIDGDGDFVIAWASARDGSDHGIFARRFSAAGVAQGGEFQVNTITIANEQFPSIDMESNGDLVVVWQGGEIFGQRFTSAGAPVAAQFQINILDTPDNSSPEVAMDPDGDFTVAWSSYSDGSAYAIVARRFDSLGAPQGGELQVNSHYTGSQTRAGIAMDSDGDFVVTWSDQFQDGSGYGIFARRFKSSGATAGPDLQVNTYITGHQVVSVVGADSDGDFVVSWQSDGQDGSGNGVFGRRFDVPAPLDIDGNGQLTALTDGVLVLRFLFGFTGTTLTSGAVGQNCTRCDSTTILPYLQSLT